MSTATAQIDQATLDKVQDLIRTNLVSRDSLYAAADKLDGPALQMICRRLADELGGHVVDLQQVLLGRGQKPVGPEDELVKKLRFVVVEVLKQRPSSQQVVIEAEGRTRLLKKKYDAAIDHAEDGPIKSLLHKQRQNTEFGGEVLEAIEEVHRAADEPHRHENIRTAPPPATARAGGTSERVSPKPGDSPVPLPTEESTHNPEVGETYRCEKCGMRIEVIVACNCPDAITPEFRCCGANMTATEPSIANETLTPEAGRGDYIG
jgi:uncharacterized protein (TIGR02284 family)